MAQGRSGTYVSEMGLGESAGGAGPCSQHSGNGEDGGRVGGVYKSRGAACIALVGPGDSKIRQKAAYTLECPPAPELLSPFINAVPLQLLAYHIAVLRDCDVDQPRNLAKSVTVE